MKIENIRLGLATNSSSTHSIIFNLDSSSQDWEDGEFGWNEFCCNCKESKKMYLAAILYQNLQRAVGADIAKAVAESWVETKLPSGNGREAYIDHQSLMDLPLNAQTGQVDKQFVQELFEYYMDPKVAIVGGNDNDGETRFTEGRKEHLLETESRTKVCRKDPVTGHWVLFNKYNGTKIRMHLNENAPNYTKAFAPELVDIKITNYCPYGCAFCYQDSTKEGVHGDIKFIDQLAYSLSEVGVFEVALGGGEPTMHPNFINIIKKFRSKGIVPNFTTRNFKWLMNNEIKNAVKEYAGKFAISIDDVKDMERAWHLADEFLMTDPDWDYNKRQFQCRLGFQYVMGSTSLENFRDIIRGIPNGCEMTLLGYKEVGRGSTFKPYSYDGWLQVVKDVGQWKKIGIDTSLANQYKSEVLEAVDGRLVTFEEGKFSMYIDAVTKQAAPSSYCSKDEYVDISDRWFKIEKTFAKF